MAAQDSILPPSPMLSTTETSPSGSGFVEPTPSYGNLCALHSVTSLNTAVPTTTKSTPTPPPVPRGLPLCFIDEQELRQPSNTNLRRVIRSHARRDTDLKRKRLNTASKTKLEIPRLIEGNIAPITQGGYRLKLLTARVRSFDSSRASQYGAAVSFSETALGTLGSQSAPGTPSGENIAVTRYNELNERFRSGNTIHRPPAIRIHESDEQKNSIAPSFQLSKEVNDESNLDLVNSVDCPTCRELAAEARNVHATQLLQRSANDPATLNIGNTLLGSSWREDPFDVHAELHNPRVSFLLSYYNEVVNTVWVCSTTLWSFQTSCPALLHATMLYTASHLRYLSGNSDYDRDIFHHKGETMRIINERLDDPSKRTSDQIIGALSSLILFEETYGSNQIAAVHRYGLNQLLQLRYLSSGAEPHRLVQHLLVHPQVDPDEPQISVDSTSTTGHAGRLTNLSQSVTKNFIRGTVLGHGVTSVYVWLTHTAQRAGSPLQHQNQEAYPALRNIIEIYLAAFPSPDFSIPESSDRAWLIASMVYLHTILVTPAEALPLPASEEELVMQLKNIMEKLLGNPNGFAYPCSMRLWVMMMGGLYSRSDDLEWANRDGGRSSMKEREHSDAKVLLRDVKWFAQTEGNILSSMSTKQEDEDAWHHLQGFYGDEVSKWKV